MKTKLTLKYSSFFFCNSIQLKKGQETEIETDSLSNKDLTILNAYITSGGITSSEGLIPLVIEDVKITLEDESQVVEDKEGDKPSEPTGDIEYDLENPPIDIDDDYIPF